MEEHILRRLLYSKALLLHGSGHAKEDNVIEGAFAVLNFNNSIEMLLNTILEYFRIPCPRVERNFHQLMEATINAIETNSSEIDADRLLKVRELTNLHLARNTIQHNGIIPAMVEVRRYHILTQNIVEGVMQELFDLPFRDVSLGSLIKDTDVQALYKKADSEYEIANYQKSIIYCVAAFESAKNMEQRRIYGSGITFAKIFSHGKIPEIVEGYLHIITEELEILKLRLDYKKYQKYRDLCSNLTPSFRLPEEKTISVIGKMINEKLTKLDMPCQKECARFCLDFSIESIFRWESELREGWNPPIPEIVPIEK